MPFPLQMREIARLYKTCPSSSFRPHHRHSKAVQQKDKAVLAEQRLACSEWNLLLSSLSPVYLPCVSPFLFPNTNRCSVCADVANPSPPRTMCLSECPYRPRSDSCGLAASPFCSAEVRRLLGRKASSLWTRMALARGDLGLPASGGDPFVKNLRRRSVQRRCRELQLGDEMAHRDEDSVAALPEELEGPTAESARSLIGGKACSTNRSVNFFTVDDSVYSELSPRLGLPESPTRLPLLTLIDWKVRCAGLGVGGWT